MHTIERRRVKSVYTMCIISGGRWIIGHKSVANVKAVIHLFKMQSLQYGIEFWKQKGSQTKTKTNRIIGPIGMVRDDLYRKLFNSYDSIRLCLFQTNKMHSYIIT